MRKDFYLSKRGRIFYVQFRDQKTGAVLPAKSSGETNRTRAEAWARGALELIKKAAATPETLLSEYAAPFFLDVGCPHEARRKIEGNPFGVKTRREYRKYFETDILPDPIAAMRLAEIQRPDVLAFRDRVVSRRGRTRSAHVAVQVLKVILHDGIEDGLLDHDPTLRVKVVPESVRVRVATDKAGISALLEPHRWKDERVRLAVMAAALVGLRAGEVSGLQWGDLDGDVVHIRRSISEISGVKRPKWEKTRDAPYPPALKAKLEPLRGPPDGWVFAISPQGPLSYKTLRREMAAAARSAGLDGLTLHGLRHSLQTLLRGAGAPDDLLRAMFGWSGPRTQDGYTHRELYNLAPLGELVDSILGGNHGDDQQRVVRKPRGGAVRAARALRRDRR